MWKPTVRAPWYLFALGQTFFVVGDVITYNYEQFFGTELPYPSIGDVAYLLVYPCLVGGLLLLIRERNPGRDRDSVIDSLIVAIGVGTMQWLFLMSPVAHDSASTLLQKIVGMAYPFMDLILVTAVVRLAMGRGKAGALAVPHGCGALRPVPHGHRVHVHLRHRGSSTTSRASSRPDGASSTSCGVRPRSTRRCGTLPIARRTQETRLTRARLILCSAPRR